VKFFGIDVEWNSSCRDLDQSRGVHSILLPSKYQHVRKKKCSFSKCVLIVFLISNLFSYEENKPLVYIFLNFLFDGKRNRSCRDSDQLRRECHILLPSQSQHVRKKNFRSQYVYECYFLFQICSLTRKINFWWMYFWIFSSTENGIARCRRGSD
jgi:hypothetical protein